MRLGFLSITWLVGSAIALPVISSLETRDTTAIDASARRLTGSLTTLMTAMRARPTGGDINEAKRQTQNLLRLGRIVVEDAHLGAREIRRGGSVTVVESFGLLSSTATVTSLIRNVVQGWKDSKEMVVAAGMKLEVLNHLKDTSESVHENGDAIAAKLPVIVQGMVNTLKSMFLSVVEPAIEVYSR